MLIVCVCVFQLNKSHKTTKINNFSDPNISNGKVVIDLVDAIKPNSVKYDLVKDGKTDQVRSCD